MATKKSATSRPVRTSAKSAKRAPAKSKSKLKPPSRRSVQTLVSIPDDVVLSPQSEAPRDLRGQDRSVRKKQVREMSWAEFDRLIHGLARTVGKSFKP
ncbi:MAG TPA: hypothetical protein PKN30_15240, partial [Flavobacteriales bacterium]|nr:hypothetical protein [Flavobacteriales bacterium]